MRKQSIYITIMVTFATIAIISYQAYWLTDIYHTLSDNMSRDIQESMRASDFEEMSRRVFMLKEEQLGGNLAVSVGINKERDKAVVDNEYTPRDERDDEDTKEKKESVNPIAFDNFSNALRGEKEVMNVGLQMQRGIHTGLDALRPIDPHYYEEVLEHRLDSIEVLASYKSYYIRHKTTDDSDTLILRDGGYFSKADTFRLVLNVGGDIEYVLVVDNGLFTLPHQMYSVVAFSLFTLIILLVAFGYIISMLNKSWALDEMKSDFTNNITHELKTPIAVAYAANDAILNFNGINNPERVRKYITICQEQLTTLSELVEKILSLSMERRKSMKVVIETVALLPIVEKVIRDHSLKSKKRVEFGCDIPSDMVIKVDKQLLLHILNNLIDNAIKYSLDKPTVSIHSATVSEGQIMLMVSDNGIGIASEQLPYIFDKFYRVPHGNLHNVKGYGLGLFYVKSIMEKLGGEVSVKSELGKGTTIKLIFYGQD